MIKDVCFPVIIDRNLLYADWFLPTTTEQDMRSEVSTQQDTQTEPPRLGDRQITEIVALRKQIVDLEKTVSDQAQLLNTMLTNVEALTRRVQIQGARINKRATPTYITQSSDTFDRRMHQTPPLLPTDGLHPRVPSLRQQIQRQRTDLTRTDEST